MKTFLEFKTIGNNNYCRRGAVDETGKKLILSNWFFYVNTEFV